MKTPRIPLVISAITLAMTIVACGQTTYSDDAGSTTSAATTTTTTVTPTPPPVVTATGTSAPLTYSISQLGSSPTYTTPNLTTDNVLKVKFTVGTYQGNSVAQATQLKVNIAVNGASVNPTYTTNNYVYGEINETSAVIDLSGYISAGVPVAVSVTSPMNDFYCVYWGGYEYDPTTGLYTPVNPLYNSYPACYKAVYSSHTWSGTLTVQTSNTTAI